MSNEWPCINSFDRLSTKFMRCTSKSLNLFETIPGRLGHAGRFFESNSGSVRQVAVTYSLIPLGRMVAISDKCSRTAVWEGR
jgi:hypothetical protein